MIEALHGFLGLPRDWHGFDFAAHDLIQIAKPAPKQGLWHWASCLNKLSRDKSILVGYSLGGRLALHALLYQPLVENSYFESEGQSQNEALRNENFQLVAGKSEPKKWRGAVIVSAHPGLPSISDREKRLEADKHWAERFLSEPWPKLMHDWNHQPVFQGSQLMLRNEQDYKRQMLADTLTYWSLGCQQDLRDQIKKLNIPILWVAGKLDIVYTSLAKTVELKHPSSEVWIADGAAHRVPWDQPVQFKHKVEQFFERITDANNG